MRITVCFIPSSNWNYEVLCVFSKACWDILSAMFCQVRCIILKNTKSQHLPLISPLPPTVSLFSFLSVSVCVSLSLWGAWEVGNVLERERYRERGDGEECWTCSTCRLESLSRLRPTANTRGEEEGTDGPNTRTEKLTTKNSFWERRERRER